MKVYNRKAVAAFLGLTERRIQQLTDDGILSEVKPGLYNLQRATQDYIRSIKDGNDSGGQLDFKTEKARLMQSKRRLAELELRQRESELHESAVIEQVLSNMLINFRSRLRAIPAKLAPILAEKTDKTAIFSLLKEATDEALTELSDYKTAFNVESLEGGEADDGKNTVES